MLGYAEKMLELILGGARSGKSSFAEQRALALSDQPVYIATGQAGDEEMARRIELHQRRRGPLWQLVEEPLHLAAALARHAAPDRCLLVDCLSLWLGNLTAPEQRPKFAGEKYQLLHLLPKLPGHILMVSNETGLGIVPENALARWFRDQAGILHQELAILCDRVVLMVAGLPLTLKPQP